MSASNIPCKNTALCGVKSHRPGTVAKCATAKGGRSSGSAVSNLSAAPKLASAGAEKVHVNMDTFTSEQQAELDRLMNSGESNIEGCTDNELAVLKAMHRFEYMDNGIQQGSTWLWAFADGVQYTCDVPKTSVPGIVSSLNKKGYVQSWNTGDPEEDSVQILPRGVAAHFELNPETLKDMSW